MHIYIYLLSPCLPKLKIQIFTLSLSLYFRYWLNICLILQNTNGRRVEVGWRLGLVAHGESRFHLPWKITILKIVNHF